MKVIALFLFIVALVVIRRFENKVALVAMIVLNMVFFIAKGIACLSAYRAFQTLILLLAVS